MAALDQDDLKMLLRLCKAGKTLEQICVALDVEDETVFAALAQMLDITPRQMKRVFALKKQGDSLEEIGELCSVAVASLLEVFPEDSLPADLRNQILTLARQGHSSEDISYSIGIAEAEVRTVLNSTKLQAKGPASVRTASTLIEECGLERIEETKPAQRATDARQQGTKTYPSGDSYQGELLNDRPHGHGTMNYVEGGRRTYIGTWVNGARQGRGVVTTPSGEKIEGEFKNDKLNGYATQTWADGSVYSGSWEDGKMQGGGEYTWPSGASYKGEWKDDDRHGEGTQTQADGSVYTGSWKEDKYHGRGVLTCQDGAKYVGEWKNGKHHGHGSYEGHDRTTYVGNWVNGTRQGHGVVTYPNRDKFEGEFMNDKQNGQGNYTFASGRVISGLWKDDKQQVDEVEPVTRFNRTVSESTKPNYGSMNIRILTIDGSNFTQEFSSSATVDDLVDKAAERLGKSACSIYCVFKGNQLFSGAKLLAMGLRDGATVHIVTRFAGC
jgi:DNA-binding CsgD family transcriptional regulator